MAKKSIQVTNLPLVVKSGVSKFSTPALKLALKLQQDHQEALTAKWQALALEAAQKEFSGIKPTVVKQSHVSSGLYTGKVYHRPMKEGVSLDVWEWCDANPNESRTTAKNAPELSHVNPITIGVQFGHYHRYYA